MPLRQKILYCLVYAAIAVWIAAAILGEFGLCDLSYINILTAAALKQQDDYEVRSRLLMEAMDFVGVISPEDAEVVWAEGLRKRSAALQYAVMSAPLRNEYFRQLNDTSPNWVTGMSSPFISAYQIVNTEAAGYALQRITLRFSLATSTGPAVEAKAVLDISKEGSFWRIVKISADKALFPYTMLMTG